MNQRTTEWIEKARPQYHECQFKKPYRSTVAFCDYFEKIGYLQRDANLKIIDIGSGQGANIFYMGKRYPKSKFIGIDINSDLINKGNKFFQDNKIDNCRLEIGNLYKLDNKFKSKMDGIVSFQTLSWLPEYKKPIEAMSKLQTKWVALSSLFYDGSVSCTIEIQEYNNELKHERDCFYNIYSIPIIKKFLFKNGFSNFQYCPFEIDIDLPKPNKIMGTYTERLKNGTNLQISGPLLMPWYFIGATKQ